MSDGGHDFAGMYAEGIPPWQIDRPQPEVLQLIEQGKFESPVLDLGCGTGDNTIELARHGLVVKGLDAVPEALERARKKTEQAGLKQSPEFVAGEKNVMEL
jgi:ubiquinone/menaquinone biosynthesis C-methylase UbiE